MQQRCTVCCFHTQNLECQTLCKPSALSPHCPKQLSQTLKLKLSSLDFDSKKLLCKSPNKHKPTPRLRCWSARHCSMWFNVYGLMSKGSVFKLGFFKIECPVFIVLVDKRPHVTLSMLIIKYPIASYIMCFISSCKTANTWYTSLR